MTTVYSVMVLLLFLGAAIFAVKRHRQQQKLVEWLDSV